MPPNDKINAATDALVPGQVTLVAVALGDISRRLEAIEALMEARIDADRRAIEARTLAWSALGGLATSLPGKALGLLIALVLAAAVAQMLGVSVDTLRAMAGVISG